MPARKIPKNYLVTTGRLARGPGNLPAGWEGRLEQDYYILLHDDPTVESFEVQSVRVPVPKGRPYTPDVLVRFRPDKQGSLRPPELTEVKHSTHFKKYEEKFAARFAAATAFAEEQGWVFVKKDESHSRFASRPAGRRLLLRAGEDTRGARARVKSDSRTDFLPCFMACEKNVRGYAPRRPSGLPCVSLSNCAVA